MLYFFCGLFESDDTAYICCICVFYTCSGTLATLDQLVQFSKWEWNLLPWGYCWKHLPFASRWNTQLFFVWQVGHLVLSHGWVRGLIRTIDYAEQLLSESLRFLVFNLLTAPVRWCFIVTTSLWVCGWWLAFLRIFWNLLDMFFAEHWSRQLWCSNWRPTSGLLTRCTRTSTC